MNPNDLGPLLDIRQLTSRKEHLMSEISTLSRATQQQPQHRPGRRPGRIRILVASVAAALVLGGTATAVAVSKGVFRNENGVVGIEGSALSPAYKGKKVTPADITALEKQGKALYSANNRELACQGISLYFDTDAERQAYLHAFEPRHQAALKEQAAHPNEDPCEAYADSPQFVEPNVK